MIDPSPSSPPLPREALHIVTDVGLAVCAVNEFLPRTFDKGRVDAAVNKRRVAEDLLR